MPLPKIPKAKEMFLKNQKTFLEMAFYMFILVLVVFPLHEFKKKKMIYLCSTCVKGLVNVAHNTVHKQVKSLCKGPYTPLYTYLNEELD